MDLWRAGPKPVDYLGRPLYDEFVLKVPLYWRIRIADQEVLRIWSLLPEECYQEHACLAPEHCVDKEVTLLYIGGGTINQAAESNELTVDEFQQMNESLRSLEHDQVDVRFQLSAVVRATRDDGDIFSFGAQALDDFPSAASLVLHMGRGGREASSLVRSALLSNACTPLDSPLAISGKVQLVTSPEVSRAVPIILTMQREEDLIVADSSYEPPGCNGRFVHIKTTRELWSLQKRLPMGGPGSVSSTFCAQFKMSRRGRICGAPIAEVCQRFIDLFEGLGLGKAVLFSSAFDSSAVRQGAVLIRGFAAQKRYLGICDSRSRMPNGYGSAPTNKPDSQSTASRLTKIRDIIDYVTARAIAETVALSAVEQNTDVHIRWRVMEMLGSDAYDLMCAAIRGGDFE